MKRDPIRDAFMKGFACACGIAAGIYTEEAAEQIMNESGFAYADLKKAGAEEFDLKPLRKLKRLGYIR